MAMARKIPMVWAVSSSVKAWATALTSLTGAYGVPGLWNFIDPANFGLNVRNPEYPKALAFFQVAVDAKVIDPDWPTLTRDDFRARWKQGLFGIMWEDFAALSKQVQLRAIRYDLPDGEWIPVAAPGWPKW